VALQISQYEELQLSTNSIQSSTAISELAATLTRRLDADNDGKLSQSEFTGFLSQFLGAIDRNPLTTAAPSGLPSSPAANRQPVGIMGGFDPVKMADTSHSTLKYQVGRILQFYPNTPAGLQEALPEIKTIVPGASIAGSKGDKIDFGSYMQDGVSVGVVDVLQASGLGGRAWQWLPVD
jgi:hypothetical protein